MRRILPSFAFALVVIACGADPNEGDAGEDLALTSDALGGSCSLSRAAILGSTSAARKRAIERGFTWLDADVPYSQSKSYKGYRTDCSGFVSMCWELGTSFTTADFSSGGGKSGPLGSYDRLVPGDALVRRSGGSGHIVLFLGWNDAAHKGACVLEQANTASDMQFRVRTTSSLKSGGYKAIRADKLANDEGAPAGGDQDQPGDDSGGIDDPGGAQPGDDPAPQDPGGQGGGQGGGQACASDGACNPGNNGSGMICEGGQCVPGCRLDIHCPDTAICIDGLCL